jgi:hypothetical protein
LHGASEEISRFLWSANLNRPLNWFVLSKIREDRPEISLGLRGGFDGLRQQQATQTKRT